MIDWMDNFRIYGTDAGRTARLVNGIYAEASRADLIADPDPTAGGFQVLRKFGGGLGGDLRKVIAAPQTTVGALARFYLYNLPSGTGIGLCPSFFSFRDVNNNPLIRISLDPSGNIVAFRNDAGGEVQIGITPTPALVANAWKHMEAKVVVHATAGSVEVRVEGVSVLSIPGIRTTSSNGAIAPSIQQVAQQSCQTAGACDMLMKDYIIWNNTGAANTDFMGSCQVYEIIPDADVALNWTPSAGGTGYNLINEATPDDDTSYIQAPFPAPAAYKSTLSDLPVNVTSVRGVMPIHRSRKLDGGDGNVQVGLINGGSTSLGADRPITTAYTYWYDVFDTAPGGGAWSRLIVNGLNLQLNRTL